MGNSFVCGLITTATTGCHLLGMSSHFWGLKIRPVVLNTIFLEGSCILGSWPRHSYGSYADIDSIFPIRAFQPSDAVETCKTTPMKASSRREPTYTKRGATVTSLGLFNPSHN